MDSPECQHKKKLLELTIEDLKEVIEECQSHQENSNLLDSNKSSNLSKPDDTSKSQNVENFDDGDTQIGIDFKAGKPQLSHRKDTVINDSLTVESQFNLKEKKLKLWNDHAEEKITIVQLFVESEELDKELIRRLKEELGFYGEYDWRNKVIDKLSGFKSGGL